MLAEGKIADLLVLNSNPLDDIRNTTDIRYVVKNGVVYDADTLDELWPRQKPFGDHYWVDEDALRNDTRATDYWDRRDPTTNGRSETGNAPELTGKLSGVSRG